MQSRRDFPAFVEMRIGARAVAERVHPDREHARKVCIRFVRRYAWSQPSEPLKSKGSQLQAAAVERERRQYIEILVNQAEAARHHAHDLARLPVDHDAAADGRALAAKAPLPVAIAQHHGPCAVPDDQMPSDSSFRLCSAKVRYIEGERPRPLWKLDSPPAPGACIHNAASRA